MEIDFEYIGPVIILWAVTLIPVWGNIPFFNFPDEFMRLHIKIIYTVVMLPLTYFIVNGIANRG